MGRGYRYGTLHMEVNALLFLAQRELAFLHDEMSAHDAIKGAATGPALLEALGEARLAASRLLLDRAVVAHSEHAEG